MKYHIAIIVLLCGHVFAACSGSSPTRTAANATLAEVQACITAATSGDTIRVPAGSATWNGTLDLGNLSTGKDLTILGASQWTTGTTTITNGTFLIGQDSGVAQFARIAGFTLLNNNGGLTFYVHGGNTPSAKRFRIDHNIITYTPTATDAIYAFGDALPAYGVIDHNTLTNARIVSRGDERDPSPWNGQGSTRWAEPLGWGTDNYVYIEDNAFIYTGANANGYLNTTDGNQGCRYVFRFNTVKDGRAEWHTLQGDNQRGCMAWEVYGNSWTNDADPSYRQWLIRGGTGVVFHETSDGNPLNRDIFLDNGRSSETSIAPQISTFGFCGCNNSSCTAYAHHPVDANNPAQADRLCRDQIGASTDAFLWQNYSLASVPAQAFQPAYIWKNTDPSGELPVTVQCPEGAGNMCANQNLQIALNSTYFTYNASFNGSSGVGEGTLANRPATCSLNVGYFATDQGNWNVAPNNGQYNGYNKGNGVLYTCTDPNNANPSLRWSVGYTPYTYPHPLVSQAVVYPTSMKGYSKIYGNAKPKQ